MKIQYIDEFSEIVYEDPNATLVPTIGDLVWFGDVFYIENIVWYPAAQSINVYVKSEAPIVKSTVPESVVPTVSINSVNRAQKTADKAIKETTELKRQLFSIRQFLRTQNK